LPLEREAPALPFFETFRKGWRPERHSSAKHSLGKRAVTPFDRFIRIADRLGQVAAGSLLADLAIHKALGLAGVVMPYTRNEVAARSLLPAGFEWLPSTYSGGVVYAACRRSGIDGAWPYPPHGQWGATLALALCGAVMRANAALVKG
jgi:hypothetical protein